MLRTAVTTILAILLCTTAAGTAQAQNGAAGAAAPTVGPVAVRPEPGSVLNPDGRRRMLLAAHTDVAMCGYEVWRGRHVVLGPPSWSLLDRRDLPGPTTALHFVDTTPPIPGLGSWSYRVRATGCDGQPGPYTQVTESLYDVLDDADGLSLAGPTDVVTSSSSFGGTHQVARGRGTQVTFRVVTKRFVALYAKPGPTGGVAEVFLDGVQVGRVSFYAPQPGPSRAVWVQRSLGASDATRAVRLVLAEPGAGGGTTMSVDAVATAQSVKHGFQ